MNPHDTLHMTARRHAKVAERRRTLTPEQIQIVQTLAHQFYAVVPREYRTYCAFTACIARAALRALGLDASLLACQMWCVTPQDNYVVGFLDSAVPEKGRWNGHVVCAVGHFFVDAAVCNFERDFQLQVPTVVYGQMFGDSTTVIARVNIADGAQLWWHHPPQGVDTRVPEAPASKVADLAARLADRVRAVLQAPATATATRPPSPLAIVTRPADPAPAARPGALTPPPWAKPRLTPFRPS